MKGQHRSLSTVRATWPTACAVVALWLIAWQSLPCSPYHILPLLTVTTLIALGVGALANHRTALKLAQRDLANSETHLNIVADAVPQVLWQGLPDGRVIFMNMRWTEITGASVEDGLANDGWAWQNWFHPEDRAGLLEDWAKARAAGVRFDSYRRIMDTEGAYRWLQVTARPVRGEDGKIIHWYGVSTDIHDEVQARLTVDQLNQTLEQRVHERAQALALSERRYRSLFEQSHVAMLEQDVSDLRPELSRLHDRHGDRLVEMLEGAPELVRHLLSQIRTVDVNDAATRLFRVNRETLLAGWHPGIAEAAAFAEVLAAIALHRADRWENIVSLITGDGSTVRAICGITVLESTVERCRALVVMNDVTEREHTREQLLEAREELSRANRALTAGALSISLAHDLGQPISSIAMDATIGGMSLKRTPPDIVTAGKALEHVASGAQRAGELLHRTRDQLARRDRLIGKIDLLEVIENSISLLSHEARLQEARIGLSCRPPMNAVTADRIELQQVIINLLLNALQASKDSPSNERWIEVTILADRDGFTRVDVRDSGIGLPSGEEERVFEPLYSTKPGSIGMGLAICRTIIQGFGGKLTARNNPECGATFSFSLPTALE